MFKLVCHHSAISFSTDCNFLLDEIDCLKLELLSSFLLDRFGENYVATTLKIYLGDQVARESKVTFKQT